ncbi:uncharacterized protein UBRO2_00186 [Ustilago bromivora]|uniref:Uncharacterized protein n=1 Tax=Ustilago bromivora TaxID=307758 RepID=A0A8H8QGN8_9BASI|nr:uncharacterized protein UBRO2_00186 [Ustilago bromivora]
MAIINRGYRVIPVAPSRLAIPILFMQKTLNSFAAASKAQATGTLSYDSAYCEFYGHTFTSNASDLEAARKASLESLYPFGMPSEVFLSHLYAHPTPQEQRVREFDAKYTSLNEPYRVIADRNAKFQVEAEARGDTDSIKSCNATIASLATSAATVTSSLLENVTVCNTSTPATTPDGIPEPENSIVQGMIETVANAVLATHANMAPLIVNTVTIPGVTVDDVDDQREALRLKGRGARALGYRANECSPSVDMCDETHLASPITHHPRILCHGCGYLSPDCHCSPHWVTSATTVETVTSDLNLLSQVQSQEEAGPNCPLGGRDDETLGRDVAYDVVLRQRNSSCPDVREACAARQETRDMVH